MNSEKYNLIAKNANIKKQMDFAKKFEQDIEECITSSSKNGGFYCVQSIYNIDDKLIETIFEKYTKRNFCISYQPNRGRDFQPDTIKINWDNECVSKKLK